MRTGRLRALRHWALGTRLLATALLALPFASPAQAITSSAAAALTPQDSDSALDVHAVRRELDSFQSAQISLRKAMAIAEALHSGSITADISVADDSPKKGGRRRIAADNLEDVFGIDMADDAPAPRRPSAKKAAKKTAKKSAKKTAKKAAKKSTKKKAHPRNEKGQLIFTGSDVFTLRKKFGLNNNQLSSLAGISPLTIHNWENKSGELNLQSRTRERLERVMRMSKKQAQQILSSQ